MKPFLALVLAAALSVALIACSDSDDDPGPQPTEPAVSSPEPAAPEPTPTTEPQAPAEPTPTKEPATPAGGTSTGDPALDAIVRAALDGDATALLSRIGLTTAPCTTAQGLGGPPKCDQAPGSPADGTAVEAFPVSSCELGWTYDIQPIATEFASRDLELFAVLELDLPGPLFNESFMPELDHAIILESEAPGIGRLGHMLGVDDGSIVYLESLCGGAPETYLTDRQQIADHHQVLLQGPAFR